MSDVPHLLPTLVCPSCKGEIAGVEITGNPRAATSFAGCLRKCTKCEVGASNTVDVKSVTYIYLDPLESIPFQSRGGAQKALDEAHNVRNRKSKLTRFGFSPTSEDAVTWVVFTYLLRSGQLLNCLQRVGLAANKSGATVPTLLLWGSCIDGGTRGEEIRMQLGELCFGLGEKRRSFSEPDVIIDLGSEGLVFLEVKHMSGNDFQNEEYGGWKNYLSVAGLAWSVVGIRASGCYELARNWCLLRGLAANRSATLVNLGPPQLFRGQEGSRLDRFIDSLDSDDRTQFRKVTWSELLGYVLVDAPDWFARFCCDRRLVVCEAHTD